MRPGRAPRPGRERPPGPSPLFAPTKARGQNFLVDPGMARRLVDALGAGPGDTVLEIGPGTGALTRWALERAGRVVAVETDRLLAAHLRQTLGEHPRFELVEADALALDWRFLEARRPLRLLSNLPYSITSPLLVKALTSPVRFERMVLTMQKEVAQRLAAPHGTRAYGRLSVLVHLAGRLETLFDLPPTVFRPRPRVTSRAVAFEPDPAADMSAYQGSWLEAVVRAAFGTRRKQLATALVTGLSLPRDVVESALHSAGLDPRSRAEDVAPGGYEKLAAALPGQPEAADGPADEAS